MGKYLIVGDVDHIQDYVFASSRLRAIRGASALLDSVAEKLKEDLSQKSCDVLRWRGGQIVAVLNDGNPGQVESVCSRIEKAFGDESCGEVTVTVDYAPYPECGFQQALKAAFTKVQKEKDGRQELGSQGEAILTSSYHRRCDLLPSQTAAERVSIGTPPDQEDRYLSRAAHARWNRVETDMPFDGDLQKKFSEAYLLTGTFPYSPEDLWERKSEGQYMAFMTADGNSFGQILENIDDQELYRRFSKDLYNLTHTSIARAAKNAKIRPFWKKREDGDPVHLWPLIPVILAGDDLTILTRAEYGSAFLYHLCNSFWELSSEYDSITDAIREFHQKKPESARICFPGNEESEWRLTLSASMVIARRTFPISTLRRFAGELRISAKSRLRSDTNVVRQGGAIDFAVVTTTTVQSHADMRGKYLFDENPEMPRYVKEKERTMLTARPYSVQQFSHLCDLARRLKPIPRGKRKFLYQQFFKGRAAAVDAYNFVMSRERESAEIVKECLENLGCYQADQLPFGLAVIGDHRIWKTPLLDALELTELVQEEE